MEITELIHLWESGDKLSERKLFSLTYLQFKKLARITKGKQHKVGNSLLESTMLSTTALVHEAYLKLNKSVKLDICNQREFY